MMQGRAFLGQVPLQPGQALTDLAKKKRECWVLNIQYDKAKAAYDSDPTDENYQEFYDVWVDTTICGNELDDLQNSPGGMTQQPQSMPKVNIEPGPPPIPAPEYNPWPVVQTPPVAPETPVGPAGNVWLSPQSLVQQTGFSYGNSWGGSSPFSMSGRRF